MSPLARALQARWRQQQQDMLSPSALTVDRRQHTTAEQDALRVLGSIAKWVAMAVEDAAHTVPYLLAFAVAPLPSLRTQVVALAALRGVLSSLPGVYGTDAARAFVEDLFLGEHQALKALSLSALVAVDGSPSEGGNVKGASPLPSAASSSSSSSSLLKRRGGHRSLLSRGGPAVRGELGMINGELSSTSPRNAHAPRQFISSTRRNSPSHVVQEEAPAVQSASKAAELRSRVAHISLCLLNDAATLCRSIADALLSSDALLKASLRFLATAAAAATPQAIAPSSAATKTFDSTQRNAADIIRVLLTLLTTEPAQDNEVALVLCSYDAPRAVCTLAQSLLYPSYDARGAVREAATVDEGGGEAAERLLWNSLKVLGWLTRGCPSGLKHYLRECKSLASFLFHALTVPVAEIREAAALWLAALLETQAHASLPLVNELLDCMPATATTTAAEAGVSTMGALVEMLRWRGAQMHVYGVAAIVCWRWMLLSHPSRVAAVLQRDSSLLATLMELILRISPSSATLVEDTVGTASDVSAHRRIRGAEEKSPSQCPAKASSGARELASASLPLRLMALEAVHVLTLSFALGSLETRARLAAQLVGGSLSPTTLRRLREAAHYLIEKTHPAYYDAFPAMEVKLAEPELSAGMRRAGATLNPPTAVAVRSSELDIAPASPPRATTSVVVRITAGGQWRQLIVESLAELTAGEPAGSSELVAATRTLSLTAPSSSSSRRRTGGASRQSASDRQHHHQLPLLSPPPHLHSATFGLSLSGDADAVAPIRVLGAAFPSSSWGSGEGAEPAKGDGNDDDEHVDEEEHRVDIHSIVSASLAEGQGGAVVPAATALRMPRTVREATLLPTSQSTTSFRFRVVQQAEGLGGLFVQDSMCTVLHLAQHYTSSKEPAWAGQDRRRASQMREKAHTSLTDALHVDALAHPRGTSPSAVFGSAPRFDRTLSPTKRNPFSPVAKVTNSDRAWSIQALRREDVLLFLIRYARLMTELPEAIEAVEDHLYYLRRQLQLCPTRDVRRRCVLNDLYMNVYPSMHLFLRFINQQARRSRGVLQMLSSLNGGTIHSGNLLEAYDAVGQCVGLFAVE
ncbi:hypothetical protein ABB37_02153 [Leptomonas pyrrhocoris]|uniref:Uncharacterized protein n=1 Tax=Leptomonas pyrrhocoris TaxID=157538 RepID=A0A0M9G7B3_LEPPY|nr:hypothetical protein ABB37_02153 [Leptomonas pyrrhocoris]KPA84017.1 hypothetical protein ABB37_02153 [Leptomonas pyrrhocoris]|eukprot:XP_015662456.1 hypothetical protein ABB37_02153 [Leptomonas pyrrhocoris]